VHTWQSSITVRNDVACGPGYGVRGSSARALRRPGQDCRGHYLLHDKPGYSTEIRESAFANQFVSDGVVWEEVGARGYKCDCNVCRSRRYARPGLLHEDSVIDLTSVGSYRDTCGDAMG